MRDWTRDKDGIGGSLRAVAIAAVALVAAFASSVALAASVAVDDTGKLRLLKAIGSLLVEEGSAQGTLPGRTNARIDVHVNSVTATFSIATRGGTVYGSGHAALHSSGRYASFAGSLTVQRGSGRYARAHGGGKLYGVIDRRGDAVTVQTVGRLLY